MIKQLNKTLLAASISVALCAGSQVANAGVYGDAYLDLTNLQVTPGGVNAGSITSFNFNMTNTAFLNDQANAPSSRSCTGIPAANNCMQAQDNGWVLDPAVTNAPGSTILAGENVFPKSGPGTEQYSHADGVLYTAELVTGTPTSGTQLAQSEIQNVPSANANSTLSSGTVSSADRTFPYCSSVNCRSKPRPC